jgi:hypothetical protein
VRAGRPLRGPEPEGGGFAAHLQEWAAALWSGDAPRKDTGPPLSVKAGCDRRATANRQAAWHTYTPSPALSAEPPAAPRARKSGQARACPDPARGASGDHQAPRTSERPGNEVNGCSTARRNGEITRIRYEEVSTV